MKFCCYRHHGEHGKTIQEVTDRIASFHYITLAMTKENEDY